jgi:hypothetical protein
VFSLLEDISRDHGREGSLFQNGIIPEGHIDVNNYEEDETPGEYMMHHAHGGQTLKVVKGHSQALLCLIPCGGHDRLVIFEGNRFEKNAGPIGV